ncbi:MAG: hypothetical protein J6A89_07150 [Clostridia bacterium]|nr:hypothetical protein [Clostridia bacterium]
MTEELTYLPTNDIMFKLIFGSIGNEKITQKFIESILGVFDILKVDQKIN